MRTAWNALSFLAVVHLLALLMFVGWLWRTDRLDAQRVQDVRALFAATTAERDAAAEAAAEQAQVVLQEEADQARRRNPPLPASRRVERLAEERQSESRAEHHLDLVRRQLLQQFDIVALQIEAERDALTADREGFEQGVDAEQQRRLHEQLTKAVKLLESLPPKQAKQKIIELVESGRIEQAVVYLNAMNQRSAGKVLAEFKTEQENALATELLERIRTLGLRGAEASVSRDASNANALANAH
jgi:flagellar motility protein MotE (MotC chaperone)